MRVKNKNFKLSQTNGHFILSNKDFDRLIVEFQKTKEPSAAVKRARESFARLKQENNRY